MKKTAFTLMELMVVVVILGMLAAVIAPNILGKNDEAKAKIACIQLKNLNNSFKSFKIDNGTYPTTDEGILSLVKNTNKTKFKNFTKGGYLNGNKEPLDPWGNKFIYINTKGKLTLLSYGSDGIEEGEGTDIYLNDCK
jgi:general secretion pathway protein G